MASNSAEEPHTSCSTDSNGATEGGLCLLDMPLELITEILCRVRPEELAQCLEAHPIFVEAADGSSFKHKYTRTQLGLSDDPGVMYETLPDTPSPLVQLWYLTNSFLAKSRARRDRQYRQELSRSDQYFPLACFKHIFQTWLVQAGCLKPCKTDLAEIPGAEFITNNAGGIFMAFEKACETCEKMFDGRLGPSNLPKYIIEFLTKLFLVLPDFAEASLHIERLSLHPGYPVHLGLGSKLYDLIERNISAYFKPEFSLEMISDDKTEDGCYNALFFLFSPETCIIWVGTVTKCPDYELKTTKYPAFEIKRVRFPQCVLRSTKMIRSIDVKMSFSSLKENLIQDTQVFENALMSNLFQKWFIRREVFPGACFWIQLKWRYEYSCRLDLLIVKLARSIHSHLSDTAFSQSDMLSNACLPSQLQRVFSKFELDLSTFDRESWLNPCNVPMELPSTSNEGEPIRYIAEDVDCYTCKKVLEKIRSRLFLDSEKDAEGFLRGPFVNPHTSTSKQYVELFGFGVPPREPALWEALHPQLFAIFPVHVIAKGIDVTETALKTLDDLKV